MDATSIGVAEEEDREQGIDQQDIFYRVVLCLATLRRFLKNNFRLVSRDRKSSEQSYVFQSRYHEMKA